METVDILGRIDSLYHSLLIDMLGKRELHNEAIDIGVVVESLYMFEKFVLAHGVFKADECRLEAAYLASFNLIGDVSLAASVVADKDGGKVGAVKTGGEALLYLCGDFLFDLGGRSLSVDYLHSL